MFLYFSSQFMSNKCSQLQLNAHFSRFSLIKICLK
uniref:Uncharacterized protein n=1 Tax=Arundo donax TaxID=35708 RepID=A0A0A9HP33_ARUDO